MQAAAIFRALGPIDLKSIRRDSLLRWMFLIPVLFALLFRWGTPPVGEWLARRFEIDLALFQTADGKPAGDWSRRWSSARSSASCSSTRKTTTP